MEPFIIYIGKVAVCLGIFLAVYVLFLRNTTFLRFNRIYLLLGFLASLVLPLINPTYDVVLTAPVSTLESSGSVDIAVAIDKSVDVWLLLGGAYLIGLVCMVVRNIYSYIKIGKLIKSGCEESLGRSTIVDNRAVKSPFSFLNYILINSGMMSAKEKELIIKHEQIHIEQRHWIDLLCSECMLLLQWFNPLAWIYVRKLKENHEFLVDKAVLASGVSPYVYQAVLVNQEFKGPVFSFANSFNYSKPLNRLSMMKKEKSAWWKRLTALAVVPMFGLFLWASAEPNYIIDPIMDQPIGQDTIKPIEKNNSETITVVGARSSDMKDALIFVDGTKVSSMGNLIADDIASMDVLKGKLATDKYGEDGGKGVILITTKEHGKKKSQSLVLDQKEALILVDGKEVSSIDDVNREDIKDISFLKDMDKSAVELYGEKAKNGIVLITSKNKGSLSVGLNNNEKGSLEINQLVGDAKPLYIVDDKEVSSIDDIKPEDIESVSVFKEQAALDTYGEEGKNGVIVVKMKKK